jgi:hypothetical protein
LCMLWLLHMFFFWFACTCFFILCKWFVLFQFSLCFVFSFTSGLHFFNFPLHYCGSPCVAWLLSIVIFLHYLAPIHCSILVLLCLALALFNSTCQVPIWLSTSPCTIQ